MDEFKKQEELFFVSHFATHSTVWHLLEMQQPNDMIADLVKKGLAFVAKDGIPYLIMCQNFWTRMHAIEFYECNDFAEFSNTTVTYVTDVATTV